MLQMDELAYLAQYLDTNTAVFAGIAGVLGLLIGSFLNVVIHRVPVMLEREWQREVAEFSSTATATKEGAPTQYNLSKPASHCPKCHHVLTPWENIPVLSYIFLRGKCRECGSRISIRYPLIESIAAVLAVIAAIQFGFGWPFVWAMIASYGLLVLTVIDFDHRLLPDSITLPLLWLGLLINTRDIFSPLDEAVIGAILGYGILWLVFHLFKKLTGKEGLGYGDFKLLAVLGAWLGWSFIPIIILLSSLLGAIIGGSLILFWGAGRNYPIPFGPFLALVGWLCLIWGDVIFDFYVNAVNALWHI